MAVAATRSDRKTSWMRVADAGIFSFRISRSREIEEEEEDDDKYIEHQVRLSHIYDLMSRRQTRARWFCG